MLCPNCNATIDRDAVFCGNCGKQLIPQQARGETVIESVSNGQPNSFQYNEMGGNSATHKAPYPSPISPLPPSYSIAQTPRPHQSGQNSNIPSSPSLGSMPTFILPPSKRPTMRNIFIGFVLLLLVIGTVAGTIALTSQYGRGSTNTNNTNPAITTSSGQAFFSDSQNGNGTTNTITLSATRLTILAPGSHYYAWMVNTDAEQTQPLGQLTPQGPNYSLTFTNKNNLIGNGNQLEITQELGNPSLPTGKIVLAGTLPPKALQHIRHLLFSFDTTPGKIGLLVGLRQQTRSLNAQALLLQNVSAQGQNAVSCAAQNIINLIEGQHGQNTQALASICANFNITNAGDGFGLLNPGDPNDGYIKLTSEHASLAATQSDSTDIIKIHARNVQSATNDLQQWITTIDKDARQLVAHPEHTGSIQEIVTLAEYALIGNDLNGNGQIEPILGEAGTITAYKEGQLMAQIALTPPGA